MNNGNRMRALVAGVAIAISPIAFGGEKAGNGGAAVVCRDPNGQIIRAEMLDIFEGRILYQLNIPSSSAPVASQVQEVVNRFGDRKGSWTYVAAKDIREGLFLVNRDFTLLPKGVGLETVNDAFPIIHEKGCAFEQVADYRSNGILNIDQEIYDHLDMTNRAALLLHEAAYKCARMSHEVKSSFAARKMVAFLLASNAAPGERETAAQDAFIPYYSFRDAKSDDPELLERVDYLLLGNELICTGIESGKAGSFTVRMIKNRIHGLEIELVNDPKGEILFGLFDNLVTFFHGGKLMIRSTDDGSYTFMMKAEDIYNMIHVERDSTVPLMMPATLDDEWDGHHSYLPLNCHAQSTL